MLVSGPPLICIEMSWSQIVEIGSLAETKLEDGKAAVRLVASKISLNRGNKERSYIYNPFLVITGQVDGLPLHCLVLPGDDGGRVAPGLAVQGQISSHGTIRVRGGTDNGGRLHTGSPVLHAELRQVRR